VSPRGELPLGAGLNAQWARLVSSHPLMAPSSRPGWPDVPPPPSIFALGSTSLNEALPPFACGGSGAGESVCASPRAAKSKGRPGSMNIMNRAGRGRTPDALVPPGPPRTPPALKSSLSTPSLTPLSHPAHNLVLLFLLRDRDNFPRHSAGIRALSSTHSRHGVAPFVPQQVLRGGPRRHCCDGNPSQREDA